MKPIRLLFVLTAGALVPAVSFAADEFTDSFNLTRQREAVLTRIVGIMEEQQAVGTAGPEQVAEARMRLHEFRRDAFAGLPAKIKEQERVVEVARERFETVHAKKNIGAATELDRLQAFDRFLCAKLLLAELKAGATGG